MKAPAVNYRIETLDQGRTWQVVAKATGNVVWTGKTFRNARTAHAALERRIPWHSAARMGNS
jgi:hypothetical protein